MGTKKVVLAFLMMIVLTSGFAQQISKKAQREKNKIEKQHLIDSLINSREFVFVAIRALPQGGGSVDLTGNTNYIKFHPEMIESDMPFFGRAYVVDYGGNGGIKFEGKPVEYKVVTRKESKGFEIDATVSVTRDSYKLSLLVSPEGNATLTINSNQRSSISYNGNIEKFEEQKGN
ncbi:MAG: DUF4251 domain-containing protein [Bacteroidia bacterium]|nr:DUF4251 domain-containing protein [Bacteroidia bacterium]